MTRGRRSDQPKQRLRERESEADAQTNARISAQGKQKARYARGSAEAVQRRKETRERMKRANEELKQRELCAPHFLTLASRRTKTENGTVARYGRELKVFSD